jgi:hypothetical protein
MFPNPFIANFLWKKNYLKDLDNVISAVQLGFHQLYTNKFRTTAINES